jgi:hypothetical protein
MKNDVDCEVANKYWKKSAAERERNVINTNYSQIEVETRADEAINEGCARCLFDAGWKLLLSCRKMIGKGATRGERIWIKFKSVINHRNKLIFHLLPHFSSSFLSNVKKIFFISLRWNAAEERNCWCCCVISLEIWWGEFAINCWEIVFAKTFWEGTP